MIEFKIAPHKVLLTNVVEIWVDGVFKGALYPQEPDAVRLISGHVASGPEKEQSEPDSWCFVFKK